jgi:hypothetical protein
MKGIPAMKNEQIAAALKQAYPCPRCGNCNAVIANFPLTPEIFCICPDGPVWSFLAANNTSDSPFASWRMNTARQLWETVYQRNPDEFPLVNELGEFITLNRELWRDSLIAYWGLWYGSLEQLDIPEGAYLASGPGWVVNGLPVTHPELLVKGQ